MFDRRSFLNASAAAVGAGWLPTLAAHAANDPARKRACIARMAGGPTQTDTFDPKPEHANGGLFKTIDNCDRRVSRSICRWSRQMKHSRSSDGDKEGDHGRATPTYREPPQGGIDFPRSVR